MSGWIEQIKRAATKPFYVPFPDGPVDPISILEWQISQAHSSALSSYARTHNATLNDLLIASYFRVAARLEAWDGKTPMAVSTTADLRRYLRNKRTKDVSNHTGMDVLLFQGERDTSLEEVLRAVSSDTRSHRSVTGLGSIPVHFLSTILLHPFLYAFGFNRLMRAHERSQRRQKALGKGGKPWVLLSNTGILEGARLSFGDLRPTSAVMLPPPGEPPGVGIVVSSFIPGRRGLRGEGNVTLSVAAPDRVKDEVRLFVEDMLAELAPIGAADRSDAGEFSTISLNG
jgi:NRPS condensation-like uncharacterized protein